MINPKLITLLLAFNALANTPNFEIDYHGFVDNREHSTLNKTSETIAGSRQGLNLKFDLPHGNFRLGFNFLYEFGSPENFDNKKYLYNYQYSQENFEMIFGVFERAALNYSEILFRRDLAYTRPYMEGVRFLFLYPLIEFGLWLDWTGKQSAVLKESFLAGFDLYNSFSKFTQNLQFSMYHLASRDIEVHDDVVDDLALFYSLEYAQNLHNTDLVFVLGFVNSAKRFRPQSFEFNNSFIYGFRHDSKYLITDFLSHIGNPHKITWGEVLYQQDYYSRWELKIPILQNENAQMYFSNFFHWGEGDGSDLQQVIDLRLKF